MPMIYTHLIVVCCHATYKGGHPSDESSWILQDFQRSDPSTGKVGEHDTFHAHIFAGVRILPQDPYSFLLFSGGKTQNMINRTEAESYRVAFNKAHPYQLGVDMARVDVETNATDSFQNLLFSIVRFKQIVGKYPEKITVVTHAFKERRFLELHGPALKYPAHSLRVIGINPPFTLEELQDVQKGELARGYEPFAKDLYGMSEPLNGKRRARGWTGRKRKALFGDLEGEVQRVMEWKGGKSGTEVFNETLPWEDL